MTANRVDEGEQADKRQCGEGDHGDEAEEIGVQNAGVIHGAGYRLWFAALHAQTPAPRLAFAARACRAK